MRNTFSSGGPRCRTICSSQRRSAAVKRPRGASAVEAWLPFTPCGATGAAAPSVPDGLEEDGAEIADGADGPKGLSSRILPEGRPSVSKVAAIKETAPNSSRVDSGGGGTARKRLPVRRSQPKPSPPPFLKFQQRETSRASIRKVSQRESESASGPRGSRSRLETLQTKSRSISSSRKARQACSQ